MQRILKLAALDRGAKRIAKELGRSRNIVRSLLRPIDTQRLQNQPPTFLVIEGIEIALGPNDAVSPLAPGIISVTFAGWQRPERRSLRSPVR